MAKTGKGSGWNFRQLATRLVELGCGWIRSTGDHHIYKTPCGQTVSVPDHGHKDLSLNVFTTIRRTLRLENLDIESSPYGQQPQCHNVVGRTPLHGLAGTRGEMVDGVAIVEKFKAAFGDLGIVLLEFASPVSGPRGLLPVLAVPGAVIVGVRDDLVTDKAELRQLNKILGKSVEVPALTVFAAEAGGEEQWSMQSGVVYVWILPVEDVAAVVTKLEGGEGLASRVAAALLGSGTGFAGLFGRSDDADYAGEAAMALAEERRYLAEMTPAEHRAHAKEDREMAAAMAKLAMRAATTKEAKYLQSRVVFYNQHAAWHETTAMRKQRADEA